MKGILTSTKQFVQQDQTWQKVMMAKIIYFITNYLNLFQTL